jgi:Tol biopolymer transport system component
MMRKKIGSAFVLISAGLALFAAGCSSGNGGGQQAQPTEVAYESARALDGSNAANANDTSNIWLANVDGSGSSSLTKLMAQNASSHHPFPSPDGTKLVFDSSAALDGSDAVGTARNIWIVSADGTGLTALTKLSANGVSCSSPTFSPDGSKIVFASDRALNGSDGLNTTVNIWVMNSDGTNPQPLTQLTAGAGSEAPVFSPDGTKIAYASQRALDGSNASAGGGLNVWIMNADGSGATHLTSQTKAQVNLPVWSPDGTKIAFESQGALDGSDSNNAGSPFNVWIVNANGSGAKPLTKYTAASAGADDPSWSPDGTKIYFDSNGALDGSNSAGPANNIWSIAPDGTSVTAITKLTANRVADVGPVIVSPDGSKLFYESGQALDGSDAANTNGTFNIWIMNSDGSNPKPLTNLTAPDADSFVDNG